MATPINAPTAGEIWHLSIEDLFQPVQEAPRLGGAGPFVINLSVSTAPISVPSKAITSRADTHVYQIQVTEDGRARFRLRLGPFATEDEADAILAEVRETYPGALTATASGSDLRVIGSMQAKVDHRQSAAQKAAANKGSLDRTPAINKAALDKVDPEISIDIAWPTPELAIPPKASPRVTAPATAPSTSAATPVAAAPPPPVAPIAAANPVPTAAAVQAASPAAKPAAPQWTLPELDIPLPAAPARPPAPATLTASAAAAVKPAASPEPKLNAANFTAPLALVSDAPLLTEVVMPAKKSAPKHKPSAALAPILTDAVMPKIKAPVMPAVAAKKLTPPPSISVAAPTAAPVVPKVAASNIAPPVAPKMTPSAAAAPVVAKVIEPAAPLASVSVAPKLVAQNYVAAIATAPTPTAPTSAAPIPAAPAPATPASAAPTPVASMPLTPPAMPSSAIASTPVARAQLAASPPLPKAPPALSTAIAAASPTPAPRPAAISPNVLASAATPPKNVPIPARPNAAPMLTQSIAPRNAAAIKARGTVTKPMPNRLTSLQHVVVATTPIPAQREVKKLEEPLESLESTQTIRALTPKELEDNESRWFVIQLSLADHAFDPDSVPNLDLFSEYRLYSVAGLDQGRVVHALRLGFFREEIAAVAVASYLAAYWDKPTIKRVSVAERERFADQRVDARKDVGGTGKHAVIEITDELVARRRRSSKAAAAAKHTQPPIEH